MPSKKNPLVQLPAGASNRALQAAQAHWKLRGWNTAYSLFKALDDAGDLNSDDLERYGISAYLTDREDEFLMIFERGFERCSEDYQMRNAIRFAFWLGLTHMFRGEFGKGGGWFARAGGILQDIGSDCVESGYLMLPSIEQDIDADNLAAATKAAIEAAEIGTRFCDNDLVVMARHLQGRVELKAGNLEAGFAIFDDVMLSVTGGSLSPIVTGLVYCSVIDACHEILDFGRTKEWTEALSDWCDEQPELVAFTGQCMIHVAEFRQIDGSWKKSEAQARLACQTLEGSAYSGRAGTAYYRLGEIHRLQGDFAQAENDYRAASKFGFDPQPGRALMHLHQGRHKLASSGIGRALATTQVPQNRIGLLQAQTEIMVATGEFELAREAVNELALHSKTYRTDAVRAVAAQAKGLFDLSAGNPSAAYFELRKAADVWQQLGASYNNARVQVLLGRTCQALGDMGGAELELTAALDVFIALGATADQAVARNALSPKLATGTDQLTTRQIEILRYIARGDTNRKIADELGLSERTIDRHVSNILMRLDVPTRSAATAYAYTQKLLTE